MDIIQSSIMRLLVPGNATQAGSAMTPMELLVWPLGDQSLSPHEIIRSSPLPPFVGPLQPLSTVLVYVEHVIMDPWNVYSYHLHFTETTDQ